MICHTQNLNIGGFSVLVFEVNFLIFEVICISNVAHYRTDKIIFHAC